MSAILTGLLQPKVKAAIDEYKNSVKASMGNNPDASAMDALQEKFIVNLCNAISVSVQQYLQSNVKVSANIPVATSGTAAKEGEVEGQQGSTTDVGNLTAP